VLDAEQSKVHLSTKLAEQYSVREEYKVLHEEIMTHSDGHDVCIVDKYPIHSIVT
jgi:hypothetical protein